MVVSPLGSEIEPAATRRAVRAERAEVVRWRRLLRARIDLLVASFAPPRPLGTDAWDLPADRQLDPPPASQIAAALGVCPDVDRVEALQRLRDLDRRLAQYNADLLRLVDCSTERLVMQLVEAELGPELVREPDREQTAVAR